MNLSDRVRLLRRLGESATTSCAAGSRIRCSIHHELQTFLRVALPVATPVVGLIFFFSFVADWNNFFLPYAILADDKQLPVQVGGSRTTFGRVDRQSHSRH